MRPRPDSLEGTGDAAMELAPALADYANRLLLGTGLDATDALRIASGRLDPPAELSSLAVVLRAGWQASEEHG